MIRIAVEIIKDGACFELAVRAESIERAVRLADRRYPGCVARVLFPIDPDNFFAEGEPPSDRATPVGGPKEIVEYAGVG